MANIVTNSEFTTNATGWTATRATATRVDLSGVAGVGSAGGTDVFGLKVQNTDANGEAYAYFATVIGKRYVATCRSLSPSANTGANTSRMNVLNSSWSALKSAQVTKEDAWITLVAVFVATTTQSIIELRCSSATVGDISYFDCVTLDAFENDSTKHIDSDAKYNGDGSSSAHATAHGGVGAYSNTAILSAINGDMGGAEFLVKRGGEFFESIVINAATNFSIDAYGTGAKPIIDRTRPFVGTWTEESAGVWYAPVEVGANYSRRFVINGTPLVLCNDKADLSNFLNVSWHDSTNQRHYIRLDDVLDPNDCGVNGNFKETDRNNAISLVGCGAYSVKNVDARYSYDSNIYAYECLDDVDISENTSLYAGGGLVAPASGVDGIVIYGKGYSSTLDAPTGVKANNNVCIGNINNGIEMWGLAAPECKENTLLRNGGGIELWGYVTDGLFDRNVIFDALKKYGTMTQNAGRGMWLTSRTVSAGKTGYNTGNKFRLNTVDEMYTRNIEVADGDLDAHNNYLGGLIYDAGAGTSMSVYVTNATSSCDLVNNILVSNGEDFVYTSGLLLTGSNNVLYNAAGTFTAVYNSTPYAGFAAFITASGLTGCVNADPAVSDEYKPLKGSPCIRSGADVGLTTDADGNTIPTGAGFDIGPYFYRPEVDSGFSPWCKCDSAMPLPAQPCKGHALPIGVGKLTVFPGVASSAQIEEAK